MILVDAGPLVAIIDADDQHHSRCAKAIQQIREPLGTVLPAVTEAMYLLMDLPRGQEALLQMLERGAIHLLPIGLNDIPRIKDLMRKYRDRPMDFADAALIRIAERENIRKIFTVDRTDFAVYRINNRTRPTMIP